jgi:hypothetical protein
MILSIVHGQRLIRLDASFSGDGRGINLDFFGYCPVQHLATGSKTLIRALSQSLAQKFFQFLQLFDLLIYGSKLRFRLGGPLFTGLLSRFPHLQHFPDFRQGKPQDLGPLNKKRMVSRVRPERLERSPIL